MVKQTTGTTIKTTTNKKTRPYKHKADNTINKALKTNSNQNNARKRQNVNNDSKQARIKTKHATQ